MVLVLFQVLNIPMFMFSDIFGMKLIIKKCIDCRIITRKMQNKDFKQRTRTLCYAHREREREREIFMGNE